MTERRAPNGPLHIAALTVRGRGLDGNAGRALAEYVALALRRVPADRPAHFSAMGLTLPASVLGPDGQIDRATFDAAVDRAWGSDDG